MKVTNTPGSYGFLAGLLVLLLGMIAVNTSCAHAQNAAVDAGELRPAAAAPSATRVYIEQESMIDFMRAEYPTVEALVFWTPCGHVNAFYVLGTHSILLCTELETVPGAATFVAAHEFAHAVTHQLIYTTDENDADEIAALSMISAGRLDELMSAGVWWAKHGSLTQYPGDDHPAAGYRAWSALCIAIGSELTGEYPACEALYIGLKTKWFMRLNRWL